MISVLNKSAIAQERFRKMMMDMSGYEVQTSFYGDFTIADAFGEEVYEILTRDVLTLGRMITSTLPNYTWC